VTLYNCVASGPFPPAEFGPVTYRTAEHPIGDDYTIVMSEYDGNGGVRHERRLFPTTLDADHAAGSIWAANHETPPAPMPEFTCGKVVEC